MHYRHCILIIICLQLTTFTNLIHAQETEILTIFAASSLTDVFLELETVYEDQFPMIDVVLNFAGSSTLAAQINTGAPADIFASANEMQMQSVIDEGYIAPEDVTIFATNQLVLALPYDNPADIKSLQDLANDGVFIALAVPDVPIRVYTDDMLARLDEEYGDTYSERVLQNVVSEEANVRQVVTRVALGEVDAGIVYQTDVVGDISEQLAIIPIDATINPLAVYPIAPMTDSPHNEAAQAFIDFVLADEGQMILHGYGFCSPAIMDEDTLPEVTPEATSEPIDDAEDNTTACK